MRPKTPKSTNKKAVSKPDPQQNKPKKISLQQKVAKHPHFDLIGNGKIKCNITGHELEPKKSLFDEYLKSRSYKRALESQFDITEYEEFLVDHKENPKHFLFCKLTGKKVSKKKSVIQKHVAGKKFQRKLQEWQQMQAEDSGQIPGDEESEFDQQDQQQMEN